jgi:cytochrome c oxidase subunit 2
MRSSSTPSGATTAPERRSSVRRVGALAVTLLTTLVLTSCAKDAELDTLEPKGTNSRNIDNLLNPVLVVAGIVLLFIFAVTLAIIVKYRVRDYEEGDFPEQLHGNAKLEIGWTVVPAAILGIISVFVVSTLADLNKYDKKNALDVVVVGQQWWWEYRYYEDGFDPAKDFDPGMDVRLENTKGKNEKTPVIVTATQMVIPTGREVNLHITSRDVIHSFWIPALNGKRDAVPGRIHPWKLDAFEPGVYFGQCTEFCGLSHARMRMQVVAMTPADFDNWWDQQKAPATAPTAGSQKWLDQQKAIAAKTFDAKANPSQVVAEPTGAAEQGMAIFRTQCTRCHLARGINEDIYTGTAQQVSNAAPDLTHFASRTTYAGGIFTLYNPDGSVERAQLEAWLRNPPKEKDAYPQGNRGMPNLALSEEQINYLVEFLLTLGETPTADIIMQSEVE